MYDNDAVSIDIGTVKEVLPPDKDDGNDNNNDNDDEEEEKSDPETPMGLVQGCVDDEEGYGIETVQKR